MALKPPHPCTNTKFCAAQFAQLVVMKSGCSALNVTDKVRAITLFVKGLFLSEHFVWALPQMDV